MKRVDRYLSAVNLFPLKISVPLNKGESNLMWYYHFKIPNEVVDALSSEEHKRVVCTVDGKLSFHCAFMPDGRGGYFIMINKERRTKLGLVAGQLVILDLVPDTSEFGAKMSDEFREVLEQEEEAKRFFLALSPGKQRSLIYYSDNVKSSDIKIRRAMVVCRHLIEERGMIDYKQLNASMKEANQRAKEIGG